MTFKPTARDDTHGHPTLASADKGKRIFEETVNRLLEFVTEFQKRKVSRRTDTIPPLPAAHCPGFEGGGLTADGEGDQKVSSDVFESNRRESSH